MRTPTPVPSLAGFLFLCLFTVSLLAGCTQSYDRDLEEATDLVLSASGRISYLSEMKDISDVDVVTLRSSAAGSRADVTEAIRIFERIPRDRLSAEDQRTMEANLAVCSVFQKLCGMLEGPYADFVDHSQNVSTSRDPAYEARMMLASLEEMRSTIDAMGRDMEHLDESGLSPDIRGDYLSLKAAVQTFGTEIDEAIQTLRSTCLKSCAQGEVIGNDCLCHPRCGTGTTYCADSDAICCLGTCYVPCPKGYTMDSQCFCIP